MAQYDVDLFVIGAGSGGVRAARIAASYGAKVTIAEEFRVGGTCVIRGCVPKKLMVYASRYADEFEDAAGFGWTVPKPSFDWSKLVGAKETEITRLSSIYRANLEKSGVTLIAGSRRGRGRQSDPACRRRPADQREIYSRRDRRPSKSGSARPRPRTCHHLERDLRSCRTAETDLDRRRRLYRGRIRLAARPPRQLSDARHARRQYFARL